MNTTYSLKRVALIIQRHLLEFSSREIMYWSTIIFLFTVLDHRIFVLGVLFISGLIYASNIYKELFGGTNGMHYLLIPATNSEKLTAAIFLNTIYHFGMIFISYCIGNLLVIGIYHLLLKIEVPVNWDLFEDAKTIAIDGMIQTSIHNVFWRILGFFALSQTVFLLGAFFFEKHALIKTSLSVITLILFLVLIQLILFKVVWDVKYIVNAILPAIIMFNNATYPVFIKTIIDFASYLLLPFLWLVCYIKLTEKQISS